MQKDSGLASSAIKNLGKALLYLGGMGAGGGLAHVIGENFDYNPTEKAISIGSGALGGGGLINMMLNPHSKIPKPLALKLMTGVAIGSEIFPATLRGARAFIETQKNTQQYNEQSLKNQQIEIKNKEDEIKNKEDFQKKIVPIAALTALGLIPIGFTTFMALKNISNAANRVAEGKTVRLSTSIRKRPNDPSDLKLVVMTREEAEKAHKEEEKERENKLIKQ